MRGLYQSIKDAELEILKFGFKIDDKLNFTNIYLNRYSFAEIIINKDNSCDIVVGEKKSN